MRLQRRKLDAPATGGLSVDQIQQLTATSQGDVQFVYDQKLAAKGQRNGGVVAGQEPQQQRRPHRPMVPERSECWFFLQCRPWNGI
ncbi:hypothetical protein PsorP6_018152 [Peronosclerospora sorghi]|uniref:Uncharacterized protein n=1 Tax=Peronosclerospora sorghi TaxID=230839 RepID=A0ACC0WEV1_9STRA|nr:hypothetical protein PsorP6_018152 [Peronosclerospora sorghi]